LLVKIDPRDDLAAPHQADAQVRQAEATMKNLEACSAENRRRLVVGVLAALVAGGRLEIRHPVDRIDSQYCLDR